MMLDQVKKLSSELRLYGFNDHSERRSEEALSNQLHPLEFLKLLLQDEQLSRKDKRSKSLITKAKFRSNADLEDWDLSFDRGLSKAKFKELFLFNFYHNRENLIILGSTGAGKTHLAISLGRRLCQDVITTAFLPMNFLFEEALAQRASGKYLQYIRKVTKAQIIILDDFGLRNYTHEEATILVDILEERYQKGSVILTSQVDPKGWVKLFEDPVIADAIVDRLNNPSSKITLKGGSYRERINK